MIVFLKGLLKFQYKIYHCWSIRHTFCMISKKNQYHVFTEKSLLRRMSKFNETERPLIPVADVSAWGIIELESGDCEFPICL